ncbi:MAG: NAD/NADP octopine/nopaline dehydrogenase family protein [Methylobacter sp.]
MAIYRSETLRNRLKAFLTGQDISIEKFSERTGIDSQVVTMLYHDERLIPSPAILLATVSSYPVAQKNLVVLDPEQNLFYDENRNPMQITICGCGNLGHVFAGLLSARPDLEVNLLVSSPERAKVLEQAMAANNGIRVRRREGDVLARPNRVTSDPAAAIPGSRLILLCVPSHVEDDVLDKIIPFIDDDVYIGAIPGPGGFNWKASHWLTHHRKNATVFSLNAIPWMCKTVQPGREVNILGTKDFNGQVTVPAARAAEVSELMSKLLSMPVLDLESFLTVSLYPANQLLHSAISYDLFADWDGTPFAEAPLFYQHMTGQAADLLQAMDNELQTLCRTLEQKIPNLNLCAVLPLAFSIQAAYADDIADKSTLRSIIATNRAYAGIRAPMIETAGGYIPDFQCRFYLEDVPYGLVVIKGIAELAELPTPAIDRMLIWTQTKMGCEYLIGDKLQGRDVGRSGAPQRYGLNSLDALMRTV